MKGKLLKFPDGKIKKWAYFNVGGGGSFVVSLSPVREK